MLLGTGSSARLAGCHAAVFGVGGVGSFAAEALARAGIGRFTLVDADTVAESNINRQLIALHSTVGRYKTDVMSARIKDINPKAEIDELRIFYDTDTADSVDLTGCDYIVDAIDTVSSKLLLIERAKQLRIPVISAMGAGNKLDPTRFEVADISKTSVCPLARVMRLELKRRGIKDVKTVFSKEIAAKPETNGGENNRKKTPGSVSFVPSVMGLIIAGEVVKDLLEKIC